jgi:tellurite resistance protein
MERILSHEENHLVLEDVAANISPEQQSEAMRQVLAIAYTDGFFAPLEREFVKQIAQIWKWSPKKIDKILEEAEGFKPKLFNNHEEQEQLSFAARLLKNEYTSPLSRAVLHFTKQLFPEAIERKIEQLEREIILKGPEYDKAIEQCAKIAKEDYKFAELALNKTESALSNLANNLKKTIEQIQHKNSNKAKANTAKEVANQLEISRESLTAEIIRELENVRESLQAKQRALRHFSIAFMGKTKAGKSTLHAIITGEGWNAIGVGKQRTTRLNRVYEWKNIRIVDTPGIGAPGGQSDEEIARSVIDESDVICYVVTNDSIQETEFQFMKLLKEKAKPLIILLNVKYNLRDPRRLDRFLKNPDNLFAMDGNNGLKGHIERIHRYAQQHYANDYFAIVPVMLLAAQMSYEPEHQEIKNKLFQASRIQDFLDSIRESLIKNGAIRRSQNLLGSTVGSIDHPHKWVAQQTRIYQQLTNTLKSKNQTIQKDIEKARQDALKSLKQKITKIFNDTFNAIPSFAEDNWDANESKMSREWRKILDSLRFEERIKNIYQESGEKFNQQVQESLEEVGRELQLIFQLKRENFKFNQQDSNNFKNFMKLGGNILSIAGTFVTFLAPPIGIFMIVAGTIISLVSGWFKSQEQKRREAVQKISDFLSNQLQQQKQKILKQIEEDFNQYYFNVDVKVQNYFDELIKGLKAIATHLATTKIKLDEITTDLNCAYAKRIFDWCFETYEPLTEQNIKASIAKVTRNFGHNMTIETVYQHSNKKHKDEIKKVLQEDVLI